LLDDALAVPLDGSRVGELYPEDGAIDIELAAYRFPVALNVPLACNAGVGKDCPLQSRARMQALSLLWPTIGLPSRNQTRRAGQTLPAASGRL
jgi:hypothetical protein